MSSIPQNHRSAEGVKLLGRDAAVRVASGLAAARNRAVGVALPPDSNDPPAPLARGVSR